MATLTVIVWSTRYRLFPPFITPITLSFGSKILHVSPLKFTLLLRFPSMSFFFHFISQWNNTRFHCMATFFLLFFCSYFYFYCANTCSTCAFHFSFCFCNTWTTHDIHAVFLMFSSCLLHFFMYINH